MVVPWAPPCDKVALAIRFSSVVSKEESVCQIKFLGRRFCSTGELLHIGASALPSFT